MNESEQTEKESVNRTLAELYEILMHMSEADRAKVPAGLLKAVEKNRMTPPPIQGLSEIGEQTRACLAVLCRLFWASPAEKEERTLLYYKELCLERLQPLREIPAFAEAVEADIEKLRSANDLETFRTAADDAGLSDYLRELEETDRRFIDAFS